MNTEQDIEAIAEKVAERVTSRLFVTLGINVENPEELIKVQRDFAHLRGWRENMEVIKKKGLGAAIAFIVTGTLGYFLLMFSRH